MAGAVQAINLIPFARDVLSNNWLHLGLKVTIGVLVYVSSVMALWVLSGRPIGPESQILKLVRSIVDRRKANI